MAKMTITKALAELKLLNARINKIITESIFVVPLQKDKKINGRLTKAEFETLSKSKMDSVNDLIALRSAIKSAIVKSNASTYVTIGGVTMTVAEAIERKSSIDYEKSFLQMLDGQLRRSEATVNKGNEDADKKAMEAVLAALGKDASKTAREDDIKAIYDPIYTRYCWEVFDPSGVARYIDTLGRQVEDFEMNVDFELSTSNATTFIEV